MNQTRKILRSTKAKWTPLETCDTSQLHGKKVRDFYTTMYDICKTMFSDQTGQFPMRLQSSNKYIMVLVNYDSNAILVEPMKSHKDAEMIQAYTTLILWLKRAGIIPKKHVLDNKVSENMKNHICNTCKMNMELVPQGCHRRNAAEVAICNFKSHFVSILAGVANDFPQNLWDLSVTTNRDHTQSHLATECNANSFSTCTPQRTIWLQQNAACTNKIWGTNPRADRQARDMGVPVSWRVVSLHLPRTLSYTHMLCQGHQKWMPFGHRPFQTQKHNKSHHHPRRQSNASIGGVHQNNYSSHRKNNSTGGKKSPVHCKSNTGSTAQEWCTH